MNHKSYPKGYRQIAVLDFVRSRKQLKIVCYGSLTVVAVMLLFGLIAYPFGPTWALLKSCWWSWLAVPVMYLAYIPLHELVHGVLMHVLSGVKPNYGFRLCYAYAGSNVCFDKFSHNLIAVAPLIVGGAVLFSLERMLPSGWFWLIYLIQISNVSGSFGDVYCALYLMRMPRDIVIQDTGTRMRILAPRPNNEEQK